MQWAKQHVITIPNNWKNATAKPTSPINLLDVLIKFKIYSLYNWTTWMLAILSHLFWHGYGYLFNVHTTGLD